MTQDDFNKAPLIEQILYDTTGMLTKNHTDIIEAMNKYHEAKLKLLGIADVSNLLFCGICEEENEHRELADGSLECEGCGNIAKL